ncbi:MAG TPA: hypothetical protein VK186_13985, partial [Candidatus Deferrimicrobium sp.]|nr:hypothetical protein [Candidatus Deferrimicrobium sp.]
MNKWRLVLVMLIGCFSAGSSSEFQAQKGNILSLDANNGLKPANVKIEKDYGKMPLYFIPNKGQMDKQVYYYVQGKDKTVYFTPGGVTYSLASLPETPGPGAGNALKQGFPGTQQLKDSSKQSQRWIVKM